MEKVFLWISVITALLLAYMVIEYVELKIKKKSLDREAAEQAIMIGQMSRIIKDLTEVRNEVPDDCSFGPWCQGCVYVKNYYKYLGARYGAIDTIYCGKEDACKNFIQRENR